MRFNSLAELHAAYDSGDLSRDLPLVLDNDVSTVYVRDRFGEGMECLFRGGGPGELIEEALTLLGIPWENA